MNILERMSCMSPLRFSEMGRQVTSVSKCRLRSWIPMTVWGGGWPHIKGGVWRELQAFKIAHESSLWLLCRGDKHFALRYFISSSRADLLWNTWVVCLFRSRHLNRLRLNTITESSDNFLSLQATDPDAGANGQVRYRIVNHPDLFIISENGSIYTKVPLDRELRSQYDLVVEASDGAVDPRRTTLTVLVRVTDIDDNSPVFSQQTYVVNVPENSPVGTVVLQLSVSAVVLCILVSFLCTVCLLSSFVSCSIGTSNDCCINSLLAYFNLKCRQFSV